MVEWKRIIELSYVLIMIVSIIAVFSYTYNWWGITGAAVCVVLLFFAEAIGGYLLFERVFD